MKQAGDITLHPAYSCWMNFKTYQKSADQSIKKYCRFILTKISSRVVNTAVNELSAAIEGIYHIKPREISENHDVPCIELSIEENNSADSNQVCGFTIKHINEKTTDKIVISGTDECAVLYGVFRFIFSLGLGKSIDNIQTEQKTYNRLRMINQWDNLSGDIERGYSGRSIFYENGKITKNYARIRDYARLLSSVGINHIVLNNVNVHEEETKFITDKYLPELKKIAAVFSDFGIRILLSVNFAAPIVLGRLSTADPLDKDVQRFWHETANKIYSYIPDFAGFLVKADSESSPGPYTYGRDHAQGANMLADALRPHGGIVVWRCFVYNCHADWRNRKLDRAKAAYENFVPLDGRFKDNVVLQIKNGPMDFQIREPVNPLFGSLEKTNQVIEFQITQEYTGHQIDLCFLPSLWKESLDFDTAAKGKNSLVRDVVNGKLFHTSTGGIAGVSNIGDSPAWTGNPLAQANLFGFGRLSWDPALSCEDIASEWATLTFGSNVATVEKITNMLLRSREIYEDYTCPLGIGWFVNPDSHYGPNVDGYEYSHWGTYHYADLKGIGVDRTMATGTGFTGQYKNENAQMYEHIESCPENLLLFFHHMPYDFVLKSGLTILQHIYDRHFRGVEEVVELQKIWDSLQDEIDPDIFQEVRHRFELQLKNAIEWRDVVNTYFYRKTGIPDEKGRYIYP
ncbi:Alpha-glucuronidase [[Clostridium] cellulosi]|uniref:Xylan alpha-1,2-glucuronidase n=1 Tax=[Clostridium] cellulosi TaxID=29343 RepID=A0A078KI34_9FIRM|nr:Alpha-glucuronidase [[Clostridium] cellulosi]